MWRLVQGAWNMHGGRQGSDPVSRVDQSAWASHCRLAAGGRRSFGRGGRGSEAQARGRGDRRLLSPLFESGERRGDGLAGSGCFVADLTA